MSSKKRGFRYWLADRIIHLALRINDIPYKSLEDRYVDSWAQQIADWVCKHTPRRLERWEKFENGPVLDVPIGFDLDFPNLDELTDEQYKKFIGKERGE